MCLLLTVKNDSTKSVSTHDDIPNAAMNCIFIDVIKRYHKKISCHVYIKLVDS